MTELHGLSAAQVAERRSQGQANTVRFNSSRSYAQILRDNAFTFINNVLFGIGALLVLMGNVNDAVVTAGLVLLNVIVGVVQEGRAKQKLDRIALLTRPRATVIRDSQEQTVDPSEIVLNDVLLLHPGDQAVVDGQVVGDGRVEMDESLLTGESDHVSKGTGDPIYSGSFCVTGSAAYEAQKVGSESYANKLTAQARTFRRIKTPLQHDVDYVVRIMVLVAAQLGLLMALAAVLHHGSFAEWVQIAAVIVVLVPQGLFFMTTVTYASGAVRMAGKGALVQQSNAIESMSNVDTLCLDKTGTLTTNRILLEKVTPLRTRENGQVLRSLLGTYVASAGDRNRTAQAIAEACPAQAQPVADEVPFSSERKWSAMRFAAGGDGGSQSREPLYVLGAPEILAPCLALSEQQKRSLQDQIEAGTSLGQRVMLFAQGDGKVLDSGSEPHLPPDLAPVALLSFSDELRPDAGQTLKEFAEAGITIKIISGDNPQTVAELARQAGFPKDAVAISGVDLAHLDDDGLAEAAQNAQIFGRITPQQKEKLVQALRRQGHYVAMIGDGVNDVLSLKQAQLGIAMQTGSQAARSVADIVLLNDSFAALPAAFREGQRILRGMQDVIRLFLARTFYVTLLIIAAAIIGATFPLTPQHNAVLALVTVGLPTLALAAWAKPGRPTHMGSGDPRRRSILLSVRHFVFPAAFTVAAVALLVYAGYLMSGNDLSVARTAMTTAMVLCGILLIVFVEPPSPAWVGGDDLSRDRRPVALALAMLALFVAVSALPGTRSFFALAPLRWQDLAVISALVSLWAVTVRYIWRHNVFERLLEIQ